ncbi:MAG: pyridoxamine 5'-phosphate oxidase family protein [Acidimicrobiales bacterium]|nr:pyridoxamine 5'-phosphate oxidase family protein [Acidimicrobiales bacterium]
MNIDLTKIIKSENELLDLYRAPTDVAINKEVSVFDQGCRDFIESSSFLLMGTVCPEGNLDVSPRGGPSGFVKILDKEQIAIPDLNGNNRLDTIRNIINQGRVGLLFIIPGLDETLRVNGKACVTTDESILERFTDELKKPKTAIVVKIETGFIHCAKSFIRGGLWDPEKWKDKNSRPSAGQILVDHAGLGNDLTGSELEEILEASYKRGLGLDLPD